MVTSAPTFPDSSTCLQTPAAVAALGSAWIAVDVVIIHWIIRSVPTVLNAGAIPSVCLMITTPQPNYQFASPAVWSVSVIDGDAPVGKKPSILGPLTAHN